MTLESRRDEHGNTFTRVSACPLCGEGIRVQQGLCDHLPSCPARETYRRADLTAGEPTRSDVEAALARDADADAEHELVADGGEKPARFPLEEIAGETEVFVRCGVALETDHCQHEGTTVQLEEPAYLDDAHRIHLPGWTPDCPECGQPHDFEINGHRVMYR